jgi:integrase
MSTASLSTGGSPCKASQPKFVSPTRERAILGYLDTTRSPARDRVMFLLSMKAGLRAKEMASLTWAMVTDAQGGGVSNVDIDGNNA